MAELYKLTATEAAARIAAREISSEELVRSCLDRIGEREEEVGAWHCLDEEVALGQARAADATEPKSPLHGIPFGVKDVIDTVDLPTEYGSPIYEGHRPERDAPCVANMKAAGAVMLGKTVSTEFATYTPGKTRNPHNLAHTPGGSSSGSAAAVGDEMVPLAFGSQTAGSLIRPASFCGVCGFKPTHGTVDLSGIFPLEPTFDTLGYMARSFDDCASYYAIVRGASPEPLADGLGRPPKIGLCYTYHWDQAEPASADALEAAAEQLTALGATVSEVELPGHFANISEIHPVILNVGLTRSLEKEYGQHREQVSERLRNMIEQGHDAPSDRYQTALAHADRCRKEINGVFGDYDVFLAPSAPGEAPEGIAATGNPIFQIVWTTLHVPCATVPGAVGPNGLPVGVQFIGRQGDDDTVLKVAKWFHNRRS